MADGSAVIDTHALVFHAAGGRRLGSRAARLCSAVEAGDAIVYVPAAVVWEVALLARAVRISLHRPVEQFFTDLFSNPAWQFYPLDLPQIVDADALRFTRDPFDALVCAAARDLRLPLVTRDATIVESGCVQVIW